MDVEQVDQGANSEPTSQNLSAREQFRQKNSASYEGEGNPSKTADLSKPSSVADVKPQPVVKDATDHAEPKGYKRRVDTLTSRNKALEQEMANLRAEFQGLKNPKPAEKPVTKDMFLSDEDYYDHIADQKANAALDKRLAQEGQRASQQSKAQQELAAQQNSWQGKVAQTYGGDPNEVARVNALLAENSDALNAMPADVHDFIDDSPQGVKIMEMVVSDPALQEYLAGIKSPTYRAAELRVLEQFLSNQLSASARKAAPAVSRAPTPIGSIAAVGGTVTSDEDVPFRDRLLRKQKLRASR